MASLEEAAAASERIKEAMEWLRSRFEQMEGVSVRLFGGDDLIATLPGGTDGIEVLSPILSEFRTRPESQFRPVLELPSKGRSKALGVQN